MPKFTAENSLYRSTNKYNESFAGMAVQGIAPQWCFTIGDHKIFCVGEVED